jgi:hypothetical protein
VAENTSVGWFCGVFPEDGCRFYLQSGGFPYKASINASRSAFSLAVNPILNLLS